MTPLSSAMSAQQMSYGWQASGGAVLVPRDSGRQRPQIGNEAIVPGGSRKLTAGRRVLILEAERPAG